MSKKKVGDTAPSDQRSVCWLSRSAEAASSAASSASCQYRLEYVGIIAVVMAELKLSQVHRQIFLADVVICPDDTTFQKCPETLDIICVDLAAHVFASAVIDRFMRTPKMAVALVIVGHDQRNFGIGDVANEAAQGASVGIANHPADHVPFPRDRADDSNLAVAFTSTRQALLTAC